MSTKSRVLSVAAALGALPGLAALAADQAQAKAPESTLTNPSEPKLQGRPNTFATIGSDLFGFMVTRASDGAVLASHAAHASHASHASHHSHYSSSM
jgi:hypothetical protein